MYNKGFLQATAVVVASSQLSACGLAMPELTESWRGTSAPAASRHLVNAIVHQVRCELIDAFLSMKKAERIHKHHVEEYMKANGYSKEDKTLLGEELRDWLFSKKSRGLLSLL